MGRRALGFAAEPMSSLEYTHWLALAALEPLFDRGDWHAAQITAMLANVNRDSRQQRPYGVREMLLFAEAPQLDDDEVMQALLQTFPMPPKEELN